MLDVFTNSELDAAAFETVFGDADAFDDRPTRDEIDREEGSSWG